MSTGELALTLTSCSGPCTLPRKHSKADPGSTGTGEPALLVSAAWWPGPGTDDLLPFLVPSHQRKVGELATQCHDSGRTGFVSHQLQHLRADPESNLCSRVELALIARIVVCH